MCAVQAGLTARNTAVVGERSPGRWMCRAGVSSTCTSVAAVLDRLPPARPPEAEDGTEVAMPALAVPLRSAAVVEHRTFERRRVSGMTRQVSLLVWWWRVVAADRRRPENRVCARHLRNRDRRNKQFSSLARCFCLVVRGFGCWVGVAGGMTQVLTSGLDGN